MQSYKGYSEKNKLNGISISFGYYLLANTFI